MGFSGGRLALRSAEAAWAAGAPSQRPHGAGRRKGRHQEWHAQWALFLALAAGAREAGRARDAGRFYSLIARGNRGRGVREPWRQPDALPWQTPRACGGGERASTGALGNHKALVAGRPRVPRSPETPNVNVSWQRVQLLDGPRPPARAAAHQGEPPTFASSAARGPLGNGVRSLVGVRPCGDYNSQNAPPAQGLCCTLPLAQSFSSCRLGRVVFSRPPELAAPPAQATVRFQALLYTQSRFVSSCD